MKPIHGGPQSMEVPKQAEAVQQAGQLTLLHIFPTFATGGAQVRLASMANHWGKKYRHTIIAMDGVYDCAEKFDSGVEYELH
ncbi:MAG TPA: hypothetical protein VFW37_04830, partial [Alphaproteobacteria bacterium]|nr:hypothetical protein [Alphaproteobacteria bacterium]